MQGDNSNDCQNVTQTVDVKLVIATTVYVSIVCFHLYYI